MQVTELKFEIDRLRKAKKEIEAKLSGVDVPKMTAQAEDAAKLEQQLAEQRQVGVCSIQGAL